MSAQLSIDWTDCFRRWAAPESWFSGAVTHPVSIQQALPTQMAADVLCDLSTCTAWEEEWTIADRQLKVARQTGREEYEAAAPRDRFSHVDGLDTHVWTSMPAVAALVQELSDGRAADALASAVGTPALHPKPLVDVSRYRLEEHLSFHSDVEDGRTVGLMFYFAAKPWSEGCGGELAYRDEHQMVHTVGPDHNVLAAMPFVPETLHEVRRVTTRHFTRYSLTAHYFLASKPPARSSH